LLDEAHPGGVREIVETYNGVGAPESRLVPTGGHLQYNLATPPGPDYPTGTVSDSRTFRLRVIAAYAWSPLVEAGSGTTWLESKRENKKP
jgi:hypothetical protein